MTKFLLIPPNLRPEGFGMRSGAYTENPSGVSNMSKFRRVPRSLRQLQDPWFPKHEHLEIEGLIRFGSRVVERYPDRAPTIRRWASGGNGTFIERPEDSDPERIRLFQKLSKGQYLTVTDKEKSRAAKDELEQFLSQRGVQLVPGNGKSIPLLNHELFQEMIRILSILPESHFGHSHFTRFRLGGWGGGAAKCSEYSDPEVRIFTFATSGPVRNLYAIMLHETGHSFAANLPPQYRDALEKARKKLSETEKIFGVDYLKGAGERRSHLLSSLKEFVAETYMMYVTQGAFTKEGLSHLDDGDSSYFARYLMHLPPEDARILTAIWGLYRKCFDGIEYF